MNVLDKYKVDFSTKEDKNEFVSCIIMNKEGKPLRLKRSFKEKLDSGKYDLCSGHMKRNGETPLHALIRELTEEMKFEHDDILEIYRLGNIETPHPKLKNTITHMYCMITKLDINAINKKLKARKNNELIEGEFLESIDVLEEQIKNPVGNWRVVFTEAVKRQLETVRNIIKDRENKRGITR